MSQFVEWSDDLSVGIQEIDDQHKVLVGLVNELHDAIHEHKGKEVSRDILHKLDEYTRIHFAVEESLMRIMGYPGYEIHKEQHDGLIEQLEGLHEKLDHGHHSISFELMHFLKLWLTKHIQESDKKYGPFFIDKGVQPKLEHQSWTEKLWHSLSRKG